MFEPDVVFKKTKTMRYLCTLLVFLPLLLMGQVKPKEYFSDQAFKADLNGPVKFQKLTVIIDSGVPALRETGQQAYILQERYTINQVRILEELFNLENVGIAKSELLHDQNGFKTEVLYTDLFEDVLNRITYEYYKNGNWKRVTNYDGYYNPLEILYYDFTPENKISEIRKNDEDGNVLQRTVFLYDDAGNNIERLEYDSTGVEMLDTEYLFNKAGNVISYRVLANENNLIEFYEAEFQGDTLLTGSTVELYSDNKPVSRITFSFDPLGNILKRVDTDLTGNKPEEVREYLYEWDLHGNWTKQVVLQNGKERIAATRDITYYPD